MKNLTVLTLNEADITDFSAARNRLLATVKTEWALFLDSDEQLSKELSKEIESAILDKKFAAYRLRRQDTFLGAPLRYGETGSVYPVRLARVNWGKWRRPVHEVWEGQGRVGKLSSPILHTPHPSLAEFVAKINIYSQLEAEYRFVSKKRSSLLRIALYPLAKWFYNYVLLLGFLDGTRGLIHSVMMSWHSYLTWTKLYLLWQKKYPSI